MAKVFTASENGVKPIKTHVEVEADLKTEYLAKLKIDDRNIPDPFKIPQGWMNEDECMTFWPTLLHPNIFNYLLFPSELGSNDLNDYKNSKTYSYHKSGWLQPLMYHDLTGSNFCILKGECTKSQSVNHFVNQLITIIILIEKSAKIESCHCTCTAGMGEICNHVAAAMFQVGAAVRIGLSNPSCTSSANEWLQCRKGYETTNIKDLNFDKEILQSVVKGKDTL